MSLHEVANFWVDRYDAVFTSFGLDAAFESAILKVYIGKLN